MIYKPFCALLSILLLAFSLAVCIPREHGEARSAPPSAGPLRKTATGSSSPEEQEPFSYYLDPRIPEEIREEIIENRRPVFQSFGDGIEEKVSKLLTAGLDSDDDKALAETMKSALERPSKPAALTREQARADVEFLFGFLKYGYCGYGYLGGDEVFLPLKEIILADIRAYAEPMSTDRLQNDILVPALSPVLVDNHFVVGDVSFSKYHTKRYLCLNEDSLFTRDGGDFRTEDGLVLRAVNQSSPSEWLLPILTGEGELAWALGAMSPVEEPMAVTLSLYDSADKPLTRSITLSPADTAYRHELDRDTAYNRYQLEGVPVLENRHFEAEAADDFLDRRDPALSRLTDDAPSLRDEPVFILDLRGNRGGDDYYACRWLEEYAGIGEIEYYGAVVTTLMSDTVYYSDPFFPEYFLEAYEEAEAEGNLPGWVETHFLEPNEAANHNVVFVLIDGFVASSGESFVALLREMENVILVGTATAGMGTMGNTRDVHLPKSGTRIQCGVTLFLNPDLSPFEGVGYRPDLWVPPGEGLDRILAFIRRYLDA